MPAQQRLVKVPQDAKQKHVDVVQCWAQLVLRQCGVRDTLQPFKAITDAELARLKRVCTQLNKAQAGAVSTQAMRSVLTAAEYSSYTNDLSAPTSYLDAIRLDGKPDVIVHYAGMLKTADFTNARAEAASRRFRTKRYGTNGESLHSYLRHQAEHQYESACEYLDEQLSAVDAQSQNEIRAWLDRDFDMSSAGNIALDCMGVARAVDSGSKYCVSVNSRKQDKQNQQLSCQQQALTTAACALLYEPALESEIFAANHTQATDRSEKLRAMLALPDDDLY